MPDDRSWMHTAMGSTTPTTITVCGMDLADDIMGKISFPDLAFRMVAGRLPDERESRLFNAVLVSLADHGITPTVLAARLTYLGAPESLQGAVAAGLLGAGSVFLGPAGDTAQFLADALQDLAEGRTDDDDLRAAATAAVAACRDAGNRVPGLGHPVHRDGDPRTPRLYQLAEEGSLVGPHLRLLAFVAEAQEQASGRRLPINGAGAGGALLVDLGLPPSSVRGFVLIARTAGLVAHLVEEAEHPIGMPLWLEVEERASPPPPSPSPED
jgi:citrate synthase